MCSEYQAYGLMLVVANPSLSWGSGFNVANGASVSFSNKVNSISSGTWATSLTSGSNTATGSFALRALCFFCRRTGTESKSSWQGDEPSGAGHRARRRVLDLRRVHIRERRHSQHPWLLPSVPSSHTLQVANTSSTAWCTNGPSNYNNAAVVSISTPTATSSGSTSTCRVAKVELVSPA
jgi:hypothetical protein